MKSNDNFVGLGFTQDGEMVLLSPLNCETTYYVKMGDVYAGFKMDDKLTPECLLDAYQFKEWEIHFYSVYRLACIKKEKPEGGMVVAFAPLFSPKTMRGKVHRKVVSILEKEFSL